MGVTGSLLAEFEPTIQQWIEDGDFERVLCQFESWDAEGAGWWTLFGKYLDSVPTSVIRGHPKILLRTVIPLVWAGKEVEAYEIQQSLEKQYEQTGDPVLIIDAKINRAGLYLVTQKWQKAMEAFASLAQMHLDSAQRLYVLNALGILESTKTFELDSARLKFNEIEELSLDMGDTLSHIVALTNRGWHIELLQGRFREAILVSDAIVSIRQISGESRFPRMCAQMIRGAAEFELGREEAIPTLEEAYRLAVDMEYRDNAFAAAEMLACRFAEKNNHAEARKWISACRGIQGVDTHKMVGIHWAEARDCANRGDVSGTARHLAIASEASQAADLMVGTLIESARCHFELGMVDQAAAEAERAIEQADKFNFHYQAARARFIFCACEVRGVRTELRKLMQSSILNDFDELFTCRDPLLASRAINHAITLEIEHEYARSLASKMGEGLIRVRMFGGLQVGIGDSTLAEDAWKRPKARAVFAYLCLNHRQPVPVDQLIELFWPDTNFESARNSLRVTMTYIRSALKSNDPKGGASVFRLESEWVRLDLGSGSWLDFESFERTAAKCLDGSKTAEEIEQTIELGRLPFLPEYASCDWAYEKKQSVDGLKRELMLLLIQKLTEEGSHVKAVVVCESLLATEPTDEAALDRLIRLLLVLGRARDARRELDRFKVAWETSLGLPVSQAVEDLSAEVGRGHGR